MNGLYSKLNESSVQVMADQVGTLDNSKDIKLTRSVLVRKLSNSMVDRVHKYAVCILNKAQPSLCHQRDPLAYYVMGQKSSASSVSTPPPMSCTCHVTTYYGSVLVT